MSDLPRRHGERQGITLCCLTPAALSFPHVYVQGPNVMGCCAAASCSRVCLAEAREALAAQLTCHCWGRYCSCWMYLWRSQCPSSIACFCPSVVSSPLLQPPGSFVSRCRGSRHSCQSQAEEGCRDALKNISISALLGSSQLPD